MGTLQNWTHALFLALVWGVLMTWYVASKKISVSLSKVARGYLIYGVSFGLLISFGWRALHAPIIFLTVPCAGYGLFLLWSAKLESAAKSKDV